MTRAAQGGGSMKEREGYPGTWRLRWREAGRYRETTFQGSKAQAAAELRERVRLAGGAALADAKPERTEGRTVSDVLNAWLASIDGDRSARHVSESRAVIARRIRPDIGAIRVERLTVADVEEMLTSWAREGLTRSSIRRYLSPLSSALDLAHRRGWTTGNVAVRAAIPRGKESRETITPKPEEYVALVRKAAERDDAEMVTAIRLAYCVSARRGEVAALRWSDVDLENGIVTFSRSVDRHGNEGPTKTRQTRTVRLDPATLAMLAERARTAEGEHVIGLLPDQITDRFRKLVAMTPGVRPGVRFHDNRHAGASHMLAEGIPVAAVSARLGHANPRTTLSIYTHALPGADDDAAAVMGELASGDGQ
jgi:integrase